MGLSKSEKKDVRWWLELVNGDRMGMRSREEAIRCGQAVREEGVGVSLIEEFELPVHGGGREAFNRTFLLTTK